MTRNDDQPHVSALQLLARRGQARGAEAVIETARRPSTIPHDIASEELVASRRSRNMQLGIRVLIAVCVVVTAIVVLGRLGVESRDIRTAGSGEGTTVLLELADVSDQQHLPVDDARPVLQVREDTNGVVDTSGRNEDEELIARFQRRFVRTQWFLPDGTYVTSTEVLGAPQPVNDAATRVRDAGLMPMEPAPSRSVATGPAQPVHDRLPEPLEEMQATVQGTVHATAGDEQVLRDRIVDTVLYGLEENHITPSARAAWLRRLAEVADLSLANVTADSAGREGIGLTVKPGRWGTGSEVLLIFDRSTGALLEQRTTVYASSELGTSGPTPGGSHLYFVDAVPEADVP